MPLPEGYLPRQGDVLIIHGKVQYDVRPDSAGVFLVPLGNHSSVMVPLNSIVGVERHHFEVGDNVRTPRDGGCGEVQAVSENGGMVWVRLLTGAYSTYPARDLLRLPAESDVSATDFGLPETTPPRAPDGEGESQ